MPVAGVYHVVDHGFFHEVTSRKCVGGRPIDGVLDCGMVGRLTREMKDQLRL